MVALALAAAGVLLVVLLQRDLTAAASERARLRAGEVAAALGTTELDDVAAPAGSPESSVVQVLAGARVVAASPGLRSTTALTSLRPAPGQVISTTTAVPGLGDDSDGPGSPDDDVRVVVAQGTRSAEGRVFTVVVVQTLEPVRNSVRALRTLLLIGGPLLVLLVGATTFLVAGRALHPVEAIRRRVEGIGPAELGQRVPVPAARDEVGRLALTMNSMLSRLQDSAAAQRRFVSDASHELRSPLATVRTSLEVAQAHPAGTDWPALATVLLEETLRVQSLVADLLLLARADERGLELRLTEVDLDDLCGREAERLRRAGVQVVSDVHPVRVLGDPARLERVLRNLGDNAARHCRTHVGLRLVRAGAQAVLEVSDDGPGIAAQERERVFERFVRLDESRARQAGGTGLGLPIVRQLVLAHGGSVEVVDTAAPGAHLRVVLPASV